MQSYVAFGSNLGDREANLRAGLDGLIRRGLVPVVLSSVWETEPVGSSAPLWFLNLVARYETSLASLEILDHLLDVEGEVGRVRTTRNAPRILDLDLLLVGDERSLGTRLTLPHPRMWERRFVLEPLAEIAPDLRDPATLRSVAEILRTLEDTARVRKRGVLARHGRPAGV